LGARGTDVLWILSEYMGIRKARAWKKRAKRMLTELNLFKEFAASELNGPRLT